MDEKQKVSELIAGLESARDTIRAKLVELELAEGEEKLAACAEVISGMENRGAVEHTLAAAEEYVIPKGYHNGEGKVTAPSQGEALTPLDNPAAAGDILAGKEAYRDDGEKITGEVETYSGETSITPGTEEKSFAAAGKYVERDLTVAGDEKLIGENIKTGVEIFGVAGTYEGSGGVELSPLSSPASAGDILAGKEAYLDDGEKITGEMETYDGATSITPTKSSQNFLTNGKYVESNLTVNAIPAKYRDTSGATATTADVRTGKTFFGANGETTGTLATYSGSTSITPSTSSQSFSTSGKYVGSNLTVSAIPSKYRDTSDATATAAMVRSGYTFYGSSGKATGTLSSYSGSTSVTPKATSQTLSTSGKYMSSNITISGSSYLVPENIKKGITIFGVTGTYEGADTSDATARASDVLSGLTFYGSSGTKETGTLKLGSPGMESTAFVFIDKLDSSYTPPDMEEWPIVCVLREPTKSKTGVFQINAGILQADTYYYGKATSPDDKLEHTYILYSPNEHVIEETTEGSGSGVEVISNNLLKN